MTKNTKQNRKAKILINSTDSKFEISSETRKKVHIIAEIISDTTELDEIIIRGFFLMAIRDFQIKYNLDFLDILPLDLETREMYCTIVIENIFEKMSKLLIRPIEHANLVLALENTMSHFKLGFI